METLEGSSAAFSVRLFGPFDVRVGGTRLPALRTHKGEWLLAFLVLRGDRAVSRQWLAGVLWPDSTDAAALYNLRRCLTDLRRALGQEATRLQSPTARTVALDLTGADVDVTEFDEAIGRNGDPAALQQAVDLYHGPLLEGCEEAWVIQERSPREEAYLLALERLAVWSREQGAVEAAITYLRRAVACDPSRETALRELAECLAAAGNYAGALQEHRNFRVRIFSETNTLPSPETRQAFERLKAEAHEAAGTRTRTSSLDETSAPSKEPPGGAMSLDSSLYVERATDQLFHQALARGDSVVLVKGARQVGKSSLLARGLQRARTAGARVAIIDLQKLADPERHLGSADAFLRALARLLAERLNQDVRPEASWDAEAGPSENFERFLRRQVLAVTPEPLVWGLDEVDQLFPYRWAGEVFALFRSWHNERALDPEGPWSRLTLAMAYATEAHLFITDLNLSPFNVGTRLTLQDFSRQEVTELARRLGGPLAPGSLDRFVALVGGQPDLVHRGLQMLASGSATLEDLETTAVREDGPFGDHLRRLVHALAQDAGLCAAVRALLLDGVQPDLGAFYRLRSAGVLTGDEPPSAAPRCGLYNRYLRRRLSEE